MRKLLLLATLLLFTSCALGPDYVRPEVEVPQEYRQDIEIPLADSILTDSFTVSAKEGDSLQLSQSVSEVVLEKDSIPLISWWEIFDNPRIDSLVNEALTDNFDAQVAFARLEEAAAYAGVMRANLFPSFSYTMAIGYSAGGGGGAYTGPNVSMGWEIDLWGKHRRGSESAKASLLATSYGYRGVQLSLIAEVIQTYFELLSTKAQLATAEKTIATRKEDIRIMEARFEHGTVSALDLYQSQIQYEISVGQMMSSTREYHIAEGKLNILLGNPPGPFDVDPNELYTLVVPQIPTGLPAELLERRPDILEAEYNLQAQNAQIGVAKANRLPSLSLGANLGTDLLVPNFFSLIGGLTGPLFRFRQTARLVDVEEARTKQLLHEYEKAVISAYHDVENALVALRTYKLQAQSAQRKVRFAQGADSLSAARYKQGVTSFLEVLETQRTLLDVELEQARLTEQYLSSFLELYKALGGGWITPQEKEFSSLSKEERMAIHKELEGKEKDLAKEMQKAKKAESKRREKLAEDNEKVEK